MKALQKVAGSLLVAMLTGAGVVSLGGTAYAEPTWDTWRAECAYEYGDVPGGSLHSVACPAALVQDAIQDAIANGIRPDDYYKTWSAGWSLYDMDPTPLGGPWPAYALGSSRLCSAGANSYWSVNIAPSDCTYSGSNYAGAFSVVIFPPAPPFTPETGEKDPVAVPDVGVVPAGTPSVRVSVLDNDELPNGVKDLEVATAPAHGTATVDFTTADWPIDYVPEAGFVGEDIFTYRVTDNLDKVSETTVVIDVLPAPADPPVVTDPPIVTDPPVDPPQVSDPAPGPFRAATGIEPITSAVSVALFAWWGIISALALGTVFLLRRWSPS